MAQDLMPEHVADLYAKERIGIARSVARIAGEHQAEDLVHDAFVAYLTKSPWATRPGAWVATVARNRALNELRRPRLVPLSGTEAEDDSPAPDAERDAIRGIVADALAAIPERSRAALAMKFFDGLEYPEIAQRLGVRVPQAHVIVHRSLRRLGRELVARMAEAHGAAECAPALLRMAGLGGESEGHAEDPCQSCRPAWDEIVALRTIGGLSPLPIVRLRLRGWFEKLAGRVSFATESAGGAATALVAAGMAAVSIMAPVTASANPNTNVAPVVAAVAPKAGPVAAKAGSAGNGASSAAVRPLGSGKHNAPPSTTVGSHATVDQPNGDEPGWVDNSDTGIGGLICPPPQTCVPPPPQRPQG